MLIFTTQVGAQVGKAWLYLSKAYQNFGSKGNQAEYKEKSEAALFRRVSPFHSSPHLMCMRLGRTPITLCTLAGPAKKRAVWHSNGPQVGRCAAGALHANVTAYMTPLTCVLHIPPPELLTEGWSCVCHL